LASSPAQGRRNGGKKAQNILSCHDGLSEFLFAVDCIHRSRLSYFFACIDFAAADAEISAEKLALRKRESGMGVSYVLLRSIFVGSPAKSRESKWDIS